MLIYFLEKTQFNLLKNEILSIKKLLLYFKENFIGLGDDFMGKPVSGTLIKIDSSPELKKLLSPGIAPDNKYTVFCYWKNESTSQITIAWTPSFVEDWIIKQ